jgi:cardiolipin synthase
MTLDIFFTRYLLTLHGIVVALGLIMYVGVSRALPQRRDPSAAIAWVVGLALLPYIAIPLYLMFGSRKLLMRESVQPPPPVPIGDGAAPSLGSRHLGHSMGLADPASYEHLRVHADGREAHAALLEIIASAGETLDVCTFILARDALGDEVAAALEAKARAGVRVRLLMDGIGAWLGGRIDRRGLRAAGVMAVTFVPPFRAILRGRANLRNHRKMVIADQTRFWCGGRNLAAEYFEGKAGDAPWHDLSFDLSGPLAGQASERFQLDWAYATRLALPKADPPSEVAVPGAAGPQAQLVPSGPDQVDDTVQILVLSGAFRANRRILAVTPYFVPDAMLTMALTLAARRGLDVDLVLPARSNHRLADIARHRPLRDLAAAGARIWFVPHMVHAKAVVIDDELALAGSANLDARSLFLNYELMVAFYEPADVRRFAAWIDGERQLATRFEPTPPGLLRDLAEGLLLWLAFQL